VLVQATIFMALAGLGLGVFFSLLTLAVQNAIPRTQLGVGTAATRYTQQAGGTLGVAVVGTVVNNTIAGDITTRLPAGAQQLTSAGIAAATNPQVLVNPVYHATVIQTAQHYAVAAAIASAKAQGAVPAGPGASAAITAITARTNQSVLTLLNEIFSALKHSLTLGIEHGLTVVVAVAVGMLVLTFFLKDVPLRTSHGGGSAEPPQKQPAELAGETVAAQPTAGS
jgi:hypothetical protein